MNQQLELWDQQVGGTHYVSEYQHWDLVIDTGMGYFEGQVTRYVARYRRPDGGEGEKDLYKSLHYLRKLISIHHRYVHSRAGAWDRVGGYVKRFAHINKLNLAEIGVIQQVAGWTLPHDLHDAEKDLLDLIAYYIGEENRYAECYEG